jgi:hypothetical protein
MIFLLQGNQEKFSEFLKIDTSLGEAHYPNSIAGQYNLWSISNI